MVSACGGRADLDFAEKLLRSALDYYADAPNELARFVAGGDIEGIGRTLTTMTFKAF